MIRLIFLFRWNCACKYRSRDWSFPEESKRDWIKSISCQYHWMKSKYYKAKASNSPS